MERIALFVVILAANMAQAQSFDETFDWMANTLKPSEGNNKVVHRPRPQNQYPPDWIRDELDPYHAETIEKVSHSGCRVEFDVDVNDNDMGFLLGKHFIEHAVDTFDLGDMDPNSIRIENSCEPFETPTGQATGLNCDDEQGKFVILRAANAKPKIHEERTGASWKSRYHSKEGKHENLTDELCKSMPNNGAYCDEPERKITPIDLTSIQLGFSTPEYAQRFAKAFKHAVTLCRGKPSTF
jgi:hypothetical protein